jgi:hypothetical protein
MYFDAVLNADHTVTLFNGTPEETRDWLRSREIDATWLVAQGKTMRLFDPFEYLALSAV